MKKQILLTAICAAFLLGLVGCATPLNTTSSNHASTGKGSLAISIPGLAPWLAASLSTKAVPGSKAYLHAGKASVHVLQLDGSNHWTDVVSPVDLVATTDGNGNLSVSGAVSEVPYGDYRVQVDIWANASDPAPVVRGTSDNVHVQGDQTNTVEIGCLPLTPTAVDLSLAASPVSSVLSGSSVSTGSEVWYAVTVKAKTAYDVTLTSVDGVKAFTFNPQGWSNATLAGPGNQWWFDWPDSAQFYIGVTGTGTSGSYAITITEHHGSLIQGTIHFPGSALHKRYRLSLDRDLTPDNGTEWTTEGMVNGPTESYYMSNRGAGTFYLTCKLEGDSPWGNDSNGPPATGDLVVPTRTLTIDGTAGQTVDLAEADWVAFVAPDAVAVPPEILGVWNWQGAYSFQVSISSAHIGFTLVNPSMRGEGILVPRSVDPANHFLVAQIVAHSIDAAQVGKFVKMVWTVPATGQIGISMYGLEDTAAGAAASTTLMTSSQNGTYDASPEALAIQGDWTVHLTAASAGWPDTQYAFGTDGTFKIFHGQKVAFLGYVTGVDGTEISAAPTWVDGQWGPMTMCYRFTGPTMNLGWFDHSGQPVYYLDLTKP